MSGLTRYGFEYGPMVVERVAHDDRLGWVVMIRPRDSYKPCVTVRVSPAGRSWSVNAVDATVDAADTTEGTG